MKKSDNQFFGLDRQKPNKMPEGSSFIAVDTGLLYFYTQGARIISNDPGTGYGNYADSQYTESNPLVIPSGESRLINIDSLKLKIEDQLPLGVTSFYKNGIITPENSGDGYSFSLGFKGFSTTNNGSGTMSIDIGGSFGKIFPKNFRFPRGTSEVHNFYLTMQGYSGDTFVKNGGKVTIDSDFGESSIYDISLQVHRTHKASIKL